jgi:hypothetical protein
MPKLLFFSRVAFICNVCFLITFLMHYIPDIRNGTIPSTIIILGNVLAIVLNTMLNILYLLLFLAGRLRVTKMPVWIMLINFLFFIFQIVLLIK